MKKTVIIIVLLVVVGLGIYSFYTPEATAQPESSTSETNNLNNNPQNTTEQPVVQAASNVADLRPLTENEEVLLSSSNNKVALLSGWSVMEYWGVWTDAKSATFAISSKDLPEKFKLILQYQGFVTASHPTQSYEFFNAHGDLIKKTSFKLNSGKKTVILNIDRSKEENEKDHSITITIKMLDAITPKDAGLPEGNRLLGLGLCSLKVTN